MELCIRETLVTVLVVEGGCPCLGQGEGDTSLRGRRPKGRGRGKNERVKAVSAKRMRVGVPSCFPPIFPRSF